MKRPATVKLRGVAWRLAVALVLACAAILLVWVAYGLNFLWSLPSMLRDAWSDWRFHKEHIGCRYTLRAAVALQIRCWAADRGIR